MIDISITDSPFFINGDQVVSVGVQSTPIGYVALIDLSKGGQILRDCKTFAEFEVLIEQIEEDRRK